MLKIVIYNQSYRLPNPENRQIEKEEKKITKTHDSLRRSRVAVHDIIACNKWDYWVTLTFNPKKVDRYSYNACATKVRNWLHRQSGMRYIVVPETHKDGAYHFHALIANYQGRLKDTGKKTKYGSPILKGSYTSGFNEFVKIDENSEYIAKYMTKQYITKDMLKLHGRKRYWASQGLDRPVKLINFDLKKMAYIYKNRKPDFITESVEIHQVKDLPVVSDFAQFVVDRP